MKKLLLSITILLSIFSCKKEEVYTSEKLIGTWYVKTEVNNNGLSLYSDSTISNVSSISNDEAYIDKLFSTDYGIKVNLINNSIIIKSQKFNPYDTMVSGDGIFIDNNFTLNVLFTNIDTSVGFVQNQYKFTFYK